MAPGRVLVIAGSDCSGGAGLEADQKVIAAHGCYAMTATTALTAQNTQGVYDIHPVPPAFVARQIDACLGDIGADVVKTGMLASAEAIGAVAARLAAWQAGAARAGRHHLVLDPVMIATTGAALLPASALRQLREELLPLATVVTPNVPEARALLQDALAAAAVGPDLVAWPEVESVEDLEELARGLLLLMTRTKTTTQKQKEEEEEEEEGRGSSTTTTTTPPRWVLVKGGHTPFRRRDGRVARSSEEKEVVMDVLVGRGGGGGGGGGDSTTTTVVRIETAWVESRNTHGTGCSLASAIASNLAMGIEDVPRAVRLACRYVRAGIETAPGFGHGSGPLNHFHSTFRLPFSPGHFVEWMLDRPDVGPVWDRFIHHPFVMAMGTGSLPLESFKGYLVQDYLYLIQFARANALAAYKSKNMTDISAASGIVLHIERETQLHLTYCNGFGLSRQDMEETEEKMACTAYTRYVLDIGQSGDWLGLQVALAPCLLGYGALAKMLYAHPLAKRDGNTYWAWIENYVAEDYVQAVETGSQLLEEYAAEQSPSRIEELVKIFIHATKMEIGFWEMFPYE